MKNILIWLAVAMVLIIIAFQSAFAFISIWFDEWAEASNYYEESNQPSKERFDDWFKNN